MRDRICIILLNSNEKANTLNRLESLYKIDYKLFVPLVVDQGSTDGSVKAIRASYPLVPIFENRENLGVAGGHNVAMEWAVKKPFKWILLPDLFLTPNCLSNFIEKTKAYPDVKIFDDEGFFIHRSVIETIGLFDPRFFLYYDKTDYYFRARRRGFAVQIKNKEIFSCKTPQDHYFWWRSQLLWMERNLPLHERSGIWGLLRNLERGHIRASLLGVLHYYLGKFGDCPNWIF